MTNTISNNFEMKQYVKIPTTTDFSKDFVFNFSQTTPQTTTAAAIQLWDTDLKALLQNSTEQMGISSYSFSKLKDDNTAIAKSQKHLFDLMKYYEGDRYYYYEAITTPYKDKYGNNTCGFGELTDKPMTSQKAYETMCNKLATASSEVKNVLNKKIGKGTYEALPNSIKEALIDLCYNKGLSKISTNSALLSAIKSKDYSGVIKSGVYVYSGRSDAEKVEDAGLWRRSLNRAILAMRDLEGNELQQAKQEIENIYKKALACHKSNKISTLELEKIYEQYKYGKISSRPINAESYKIKIDESFKGKGLLSVAQSAYKALGETDTTFEKFYAELKRINNNPEAIRIGQELKIPYVKANQAMPKVENFVANKIESNPEEKTEESGFFTKIWGGIKKVLNTIGNFVKNIFCGNEKGADASDANTPFKKMLKTAAIKQEGEFQIVSQEYNIKKGDTLWSLSRKFGTSEEIICNDNEIEDKHVIKAGQNIQIQKLGYKVKKEDNLAKIAEKFGLNKEIIMDLNNIESEESIKTDEILEIPGFVYKVRQGDTLTKIAQNVGVELDSLIKINGLSDGKIYPEQKIFIVYNNSDYAVSKDKKKVVVDETTNTKTEIIDMSNNAKLAKRPLLQQKQRVNGQVIATHKVFEPQKSGKLSGKTIIINAGHGYSQAGIDSGAIGSDNVDDEWLVNYDNAMRLKDRLCAQGAKVIFLQGHVNIITKELQKKKYKADMFISVHVNSHTKPTQDRTQIYSYIGSRCISTQSKKLASTMEKNFDNWIPKHEKISKKDEFVYDGKKDYAQTKEEDYAVLRDSEKYQNIPSVLWEVAFMVSPKGRERLANPTLMNNYSDIMVQSVLEYFN